MLHLNVISVLLQLYFTLKLPKAIGCTKFLLKKFPAKTVTPIFILGEGG
jgi:hypothetical protein